MYYIVSLHQTTTLKFDTRYTVKLYYIVSLHQTTTHERVAGKRNRLYYIVSLHQTTTQYIQARILDSCIISFLYIKPQPPPIITSRIMRCIISFLYIKPQPSGSGEIQFDVVLYRFSTSNHNQDAMKGIGIELYYIVSLHQTTT